MLPRRILRLVTACYLVLVGWITLGPQPLDERGLSILRGILAVLAASDVTRWVTYDVVEFSANVAMFVPVGVLFLLLAGRRRWWLALGGGIAVSCAIEFAQLFLPGRFSDVRDILANSLGTLLGVLAAVLFLARLARRMLARSTQQPAGSDVAH
jgi:glycopeptide antibiotics resistance protein